MAQRKKDDRKRSDALANPLAIEWGTTSGSNAAPGKETGPSSDTALNGETSPDLEATATTPATTEASTNGSAAPASLADKLAEIGSEATNAPFHSLSIPASDTTDTTGPAPPPLPADEASGNKAIGEAAAAAAQAVVKASSGQAASVSTPENTLKIDAPTTETGEAKSDSTVDGAKANESSSKKSGKPAEPQSAKAERTNGAKDPPALGSALGPNLGPALEQSVGSASEPSVGPEFVGPELAGPSLAGANRSGATAPEPIVAAVGAAAKMSDPKRAPDPKLDVPAPRDVLEAPVGVIMNGAASLPLNGSPIAPSAKPNGAAQPSPPPVSPSTEPPAARSDLDPPGATPRRRARRRPAGLPRDHVAANDDAPSIGGLLYALNRKPSNKPFIIATIFSAAWLTVGMVFAYLVLVPEFYAASTPTEFLRDSALMTALATLIGPVVLAWFLAFLAWRSEELHLKSTAMTEVAVRLAEPDRMAEQQISSLGQAVRREVTFMNDAVSHALSRANELDNLVQSEVHALERSYEDNERKIRGLLQELASERNSLTGTGEHFKQSLATLAHDVPTLIERLSEQQGKLAGIIAGAGENLTALEHSLAERTGDLQVTLTGRTEQLQVVFDTYAESIGTTLESRTDLVQAIMAEQGAKLTASLGDHTKQLTSRLGEQTAELDASIAARSEQLTTSLGTQTGKLASTLDGHRESVETTLGGYTEALGTILNDQSKRLSDTLDRRGVEIASNIADKADQLTTGLDERVGLLTSNLDERSNQLISSVDERASALTGGLDERASRLVADMDERVTAVSANMEAQASRLTSDIDAKTERLTAAIDQHGDQVSSTIESRSAHMQKLLADHRETVTQELDQRMGEIDGVISRRTETLQAVFEEYALALDTTLANRASALDTQLVERTKSLDAAFDERLRLFDEAIIRSTAAIDNAVGENARSLTAAMETHATTLSESINSQAVQLDETLMEGIAAVRKTSENISRQSIRAIEGLAGQADMLKSVSENLLGQINTVTTRFESQGQSILKSANALESANYRIDKALGQRTDDLNLTLDRLNEKTEQISQAVVGYSSQIEGSVSDAEQRTRLLTQELGREAEARSRDTIDQLARLKTDALREKDRALDDLRQEFETVTREVTDRLGVLSNQFSQTSGEVRARARQAAETIQADQDRLRAQMDMLPVTSRESSEAMRRALNDQLRALDQLTQFAAQTGAARDIQTAQARPQTLSSRAAPRDQSQSAPGDATATTASERPAAAGVAPQTTSQAVASALLPSTQSADVPDTQPTQQRSRALSSLTSTLARELSQRTTRPPVEVQTQTQASPQQSLPTASATSSSSTATPAPASASASASGNGWSVGDLLARASLDDDGDDTSNSSALDVPAIAQAIDRTLAAGIWSRFRSGQRGFMVPSIYPQAARELFSDTQSRYREQIAFRNNVDQFLQEFEQLLRQTDERDPSGRAAHDQIVSDTGRVYLFLAHACGRLS